MIKISFVFDLGNPTEIGDNVTDDFFSEDLPDEIKPISAIVVGPASTTWCYPNTRTVHITFRSENAALEWMIEEEMSDDEIDFHFSQEVPL